MKQTLKQKKRAHSKRYTRKQYGGATASPDNRIYFDLYSIETDEYGQRFKGDNLNSHIWIDERSTMRVLGDTLFDNVPAGYSPYSILAVQRAANPWKVVASKRPERGQRPAQYYFKSFEIKVSRSGRTKYFYAYYTEDGEINDDYYLFEQPEGDDLFDTTWIFERREPGAAAPADVAQRPLVAPVAPAQPPVAPPAAPARLPLGPPLAANPLQTIRLTAANENLIRTTVIDPQLVIPLSARPNANKEFIVKGTGHIIDNIQEAAIENFPEDDPVGGIGGSFLLDSLTQTLRAGGHLGGLQAGVTFSHIYCPFIWGILSRSRARGLNIPAIPEYWKTYGPQSMGLYTQIQLDDGTIIGPNPYATSTNLAPSGPRVYEAMDKWFDTIDLRLQNKYIVWLARYITNGNRVAEANTWISNYANLTVSWPQSFPVGAAPAAAPLVVAQAARRDSIESVEEWERDHPHQLHQQGGRRLRKMVPCF